MSVISKLFFALALGAVAPATAQRHSIITFTKYAGFVVLNNGDTLKGAVFMPSDGSLFRAHMEEDYRLYYKDVRHIRLYRNWGPAGYFDLVIRPGGPYGKMWQLEAGTDSAGVMDNGFYGRYGSRMFIFNGRYRKKIYGSWTFYKHYMRIAPLLLDFIQRYYPTDKSFADEREMIGYLAGKAVILNNVSNK